MLSAFSFRLINDFLFAFSMNKTSIASKVKLNSTHSNKKKKKKYNATVLHTLTLPLEKMLST